MLNTILHLAKKRSIQILFMLVVFGITLMMVFPFVSTLIDQKQRREKGVPAGVRLGEVDIGGYYLEEVRALLLREAPNIVIWPLSATLDHTGGVTSEVWGRILDVDATLKEVSRAKAGQRVGPVMATIHPTLIAKEILSLTKPLGVYHTYVEGSEERVNNVKLAGKFINYTLLMPEEIFSFNKLVGAPVPERGFQKAPIIIGQDFVPGYGGGVCQVSTTLYNAVLEAKLKVIEKHNHSQEVKYVPPGRDAAVAYDYLDLKFQNNKDYPILIRTWYWGRRLQVGIYGPG